MQHDDKIKNIFSSKLKDFEPEVPDFMWGKIENSLQAKPASKLPAKKNVLFRRISLISGVAASLLLCMLVLLNNNEVDADMFSAYSGTDMHFPTINDKVIGNNNDIISDIKNEQPVNTPYYASAKPTNTTSSTFGITNTDIVPENKEETGKRSVGFENEPPESSITEENTEEQIKKTIEDPDLQAKIAEFAQSGQGTNELLTYNNSSSANNSRGFSLSLGGRSGLASADEVTPGLRVASSSYFEGIVEHDGDIPLYDKEKVNIDHKQPVSFGITVNKKLTKNLSVETGLIYTYLSSKINSDRTSSDIEKSGSQYFHYLGVPVSFNYNFAEWGKAKFYISLGGMAQKDFYGKLNLSQSIRDLIDTDQTMKEKISQKNLQFSMMSSLGISYPIYKKLHTYATVGAAYYFDADNNYRTIFSDRKTQLDLNLGLKFEF